MRNSNSDARAMVPTTDSGSSAQPGRRHTNRPLRRATRLTLTAVTIVVGMSLAGCDEVTGLDSQSSHVKLTPPADESYFNDFAQSPAAYGGVNGLANAPADPATGDLAESQFTEYVFHQVADFWQTTEGVKLDPGVTFQPVDASNNPVSCEGASLDVSTKGPFYCPDNGQGQKVIYWPLQSIFTLPNGTIPSYGEFAEADAVAHEFGHYIQDLNNILTPVDQDIDSAEQSGNTMVAAAWSQGLELQADCLAGNWIRSEWDQNLITQDDLTQAANLTSAVGDDALNPDSVVTPPEYAHGTSELRLKWLNVGITDGLPADCNTWSEPVEGVYTTSS